MDHPSIRVLTIDDEPAGPVEDGSLAHDCVVIQAQVAGRWTSHFLDRDQAMGLIGAVVSRLAQYNRDQADPASYDGDPGGSEDFLARRAIVAVLRNAWDRRESREAVLADVGLLFLTLSNWANDQLKHVEGD